MRVGQAAGGWRRRLRILGRAGLSLSVVSAARAEPQVTFALPGEDGALAQVTINGELPPELGGPTPSPAGIAGGPGFPPGSSAPLGFRLRWSSLAPAAQASAPSELLLTSWTRSGDPLDSLGPLSLREEPCPAGTAPGSLCLTSESVRLVSSVLDRQHPALRSRALLGQLGGRVHAATSAGESELPVGVSEELGGQILEANLRVLVLRASVGGIPAVGTDTAAAAEIMSDALREADAALAVCGVSLLGSGGPRVQIVDPPGVNLITVGCGASVRASGGEINLDTPGGRVSVRTSAGQTPEAVAVRLADRLLRLGYEVELSRNARAENRALPSFDLLARDRTGRPVALGVPGGGPLDTDPSLHVCLGRVDLGDGVTHFDDLSSGSGTLEERALLRPLLDDSNQTIEIVVVPEFAGLGRIGESFIHSDEGSLENVLILDRSGIRALSRSMTLAHELGHVLLNLPGHPDDFGVDDPSALMDADAADATIYGPRRLSLAECERALRESGPGARVPLLRPVAPAAER